MGQPGSAIIVAFRVPRSIGSIRRDNVPVARVGVPPHVTILSPFLPAADLDGDIRARLARVAAGVAAFSVRFGAVERFVDALYLAPQPAAPFNRLIGDVVAAFPGHHPYGDATYLPEDVVPHLTIAIGDESEFDGLARRARRSLPIAGRAAILTVVAEGQEGRWRTVWRLPLRR